MNILLITPTSVSVELKNHDCYAAAPFEVRCNGASMGKREHIIQPEIYFDKCDGSKRSGRSKKVTALLLRKRR